MPAPYTGGCQCGALRYVLDAEPIWLAACHCTECQRQSGSAFGMSMLVKETSLTVKGATKRFTRIADSGNENTGVFCPECGVRIYQIPRYAKDVLVLKPGTLDDTSWLRGVTSGLSLKRLDAIGDGGPNPARFSSRRSNPAGPRRSRLNELQVLMSRCDRPMRRRVPAAVIEPASNKKDLASGGLRGRTRA